MRQHFPLVAFLLLSVIGVILSLHQYRQPQINRPFHCDKCNEFELTERDKEFIQTYSDQTKWLATIAYGLLAGLIILCLRAEKPAIELSIPLAVAAALLFTSIFDSFLASTSVLLALEQGPIESLYGESATRAAQVLQFWTLGGGTFLLASWFFKTKRQSP